MSDTMNDEIIKKLQRIRHTSNIATSKRIHLKSISNFANYLTQYEYSKNEKTNIKKIGVDRKKELLLGYLNKIESDDLSNWNSEQSLRYFKEYVYPIGLFMSNYFSFSFIGVKQIFFKILIFAVLGFTLDYFSGGIFLFKYPFIIIAFLFVIFRYYSKFRSGKVFGYRW